MTTERCGCFCCCAEFEPGAITDWVDPAPDDMEAGETALCPMFGIDGVIPIESGMDARFLQRMRSHWS
ncbi:MAG: cytoplasmic protein [Planctomycetota bacterium]